MSLYLSILPSIYLSIYIFTSVYLIYLWFFVLYESLILYIHLRVHKDYINIIYIIYLSVHLSVCTVYTVHLSIFLYTYFSDHSYLGIHLSIYLYIYLSMYASIYLWIHLSIYVYCIHLSVYKPVCIYISVYICSYLSSCISIHLFIKYYWEICSAFIQKWKVGNLFICNELTKK